MIEYKKNMAIESDTDGRGAQGLGFITCDSRSASVRWLRLRGSGPPGTVFSCYDLLISFSSIMQLLGLLNCTLSEVDFLSKFKNNALDISFAPIVLR